MKILPILLFAAFCVTAYAQEEDKDLAASFLQPGKTYFFEFNEGVKIQRNDYTIVSATQLPNWFLVEQGDGTKFFLNINTASQIYERTRRVRTIIKNPVPTGAPPSK